MAVCSDTEGPVIRYTQRWLPALRGREEPYRQVASPGPHGASPSLLLSEFSCFPAWAKVAADPAFPGGAGTMPFPAGSMATAEAALTWEFFPKGFAWA